MYSRIGAVPALCCIGLCAAPLSLPPTPAFPPALPAGATPLYVSLNVDGSITANSGFQGFDLSKDAGAWGCLTACVCMMH